VVDNSGNGSVALLCRAFQLTTSIHDGISSESMKRACFRECVSVEQTDLIAGIDSRNSYFSTMSMI